jgi:hypothetical protein
MSARKSGCVSNTTERNSFQEIRLIMPHHRKKWLYHRKRWCQKIRPSRKMRWAPRAIRQGEATPQTEVDARKQLQKKGCQKATPCHKLSGCQKIRLQNQRKAVPKKQTIPQNEVGDMKSGYKTKGRRCQKIRPSRRMKWMSEYQAM